MARPPTPCRAGTRRTKHPRHQPSNSVDDTGICPLAAIGNSPETTKKITQCDCVSEQGRLLIRRYGRKSGPSSGCVCRSCKGYSVRPIHAQVSFYMLYRGRSGEEVLFTAR